ncbi:MAG: hypothetical protein J6S14_08625 [Clostridia bacterium]|nr:hypothetical protein [Clostridia bacterium]
MKSRYSLPLKTPSFVSYEEYAVASALLEGNLKESSPFLALQYINCFYNAASGSHKFVIMPFDHWGRAKNIMQDQAMDVYKEYYRLPKNNLVTILKRMIASNLYIIGKCNRSYVEPNVFRNAPPFYFIVSAYDDFTNEFTIHGVDSSEIFLSVQIRYEKFVEALFDTNPPSIYFVLWRYNKEVCIEFDWQTIISDLEDYIHSVSRRVNNSKFVYGFEAIEALAEHFKETAINEKKVKESYLQEFYAFKSYMRRRIQCFIDHQIVDPQWLKYAQDIEKIARQIMEEGILFNKIGDFSLVESMMVNFSKIIKTEQEYLPFVLKKLKDQTAD